MSPVRPVCSTPWGEAPTSSACIMSGLRQIRARLPGCGQKARIREFERFVFLFFTRLFFEQIVSVLKTNVLRICFFVKPSMMIHRSSTKLFVHTLLSFILFTYIFTFPFLFWEDFFKTFFLSFRPASIISSTPTPDPI